MRLVLVTLLVATVAPLQGPARTTGAFGAGHGVDREPVDPVVEDLPRVVRRDLKAGSVEGRRWVRAVRDLAENRIDVDALPWGAPITVWTLGGRRGDEELVAFELPGVTREDDGLGPRAVVDVKNPRFGARIAVTDGASGARTARWVFDDGTTLDGPMLARPVRYQAISSKIGVREHPIRKRTKFHAGTDYAAPIGTPIRSIADGVVVRSKRNWVAGKFVVIRHDDGHETKYLHMHEIGAGIREGARVAQGQVIGTVGMTGRVTGPHLHFELRDPHRTPLDPMAVAWPAAHVVDDERALRAFHLRRDLLRALRADGTLDLFHPLVTPRQALGRHPPATPLHGVFVPAVAAARASSARARWTPPPPRKRRRLGAGHDAGGGVFDGAHALDPQDPNHALCVRAVCLAAEFPASPAIR